MKEFLNILKYSSRNFYNNKLKKYNINSNYSNVKRDLTNFIKDIPASNSIVVFAGLKQIKYNTGIESAAEFIIELLQERFENIIVPAFTLSVVKSKCFDVINTPSESGAFSNYFLKLADYRTPSPFKSFAIKGPIVSAIKNLQFENDFDCNGIFEFIHNNKIPSLNLGTSDIRPICIHYSEYLKKVPYSKIEIINIKVINSEFGTIKKDYSRFGYKLNYKINRDKIESDLIQNKLIQSQMAGGLCMRYIPQEGYFLFFLEKIEYGCHYLIN